MAEIRTVDWTMEQLEIVLKSLKKNKARDPNGWINDLFMLHVEGDDLQISQDMSHLWTNFAISGDFVTRSKREVPAWTEKDPRYLKIDVHEEILYDYIYTWSNPERYSNC